jgi:phosphoribosylamine--glycine ligase
MKILVVGGGGREHALVWRLARDSAKPDLFCAPGNAGTAALAQNLAIEASDGAGLLAWARRERPDLTVVGPEAPLCEGLVDVFQAEGLAAFGPCREAARLEGSKVFSKEVMVRAGVPTARAEAFNAFEPAAAHVRRLGGPAVIKADGLAAGKGVLICPTPESAEEALREAMVRRAFGEAGRQVLVEEFLEGEEVSVLAFVDGANVALLPAAQDHKRVNDGDQGPNTGGMGAYAPAPVATARLLDQARDTVFLPTLAELRRRGIPYKGVLYAGLMATPAGLRVLEFNARFGDPETQAILPLLDGDLIPLLRSCIEGGLACDSAPVRRAHAACVVMTAGGYPGAIRKGDPIEGLAEAAALPDVMVFHAGTRLERGRAVTAGGRVLGVTGLGPTLADAIRRAYAAVEKISFTGAHWRRDIGARGLKRAGEAT